jgi:hypothetical protein
MVRSRGSRSEATANRGLGDNRRAERDIHRENTAHSRTGREHRATEDGGMNPDGWRRQSKQPERAG